MCLGHFAKARSAEKQWAWSGLALIKRAAPRLRLSTVITVRSVRGPGSEPGKRGGACLFTAGA